MTLIRQTAELRHFKLAFELTSIGATRPKAAIGDDIRGPADAACIRIYNQAESTMHRTRKQVLLIKTKVSGYSSASSAVL
jgi:hypothetical protein